MQVRRDIPDAPWDRFVGAARGGTYQQTSMWAQVKAGVGWQAERLVVESEGTIIGGCQLLIRPLPVVGAIAYAPRGPVIPESGTDVLDVVLSAVHRLARKRRIRYLASQPPPEGHHLGSALQARGFAESALEIAPMATTRIDLHESIETLFGAMHETTRRNVRKAGRLEVLVREGNRADLPVFRELLVATADRQRFSLYPAEYYEEMWQVFASRGDARLLVAEHHDEVLAM